VYAPLLNPIAPCPRTRSKLLLAAIVLLNCDGQVPVFTLLNERFRLSYKSKIRFLFE
jgi:hypothetical protein